MRRSASARAQPARKEGYHHGDLRRALLDATLQLVDTHGPQGFTLRKAAQAAGVTPGATYHHFEDKDALIAAVAEEGFELLDEQLRAAAERPAASARDRSRNVGVAYVRFAVRYPTRFRVMVGYGVSRSPRRGPGGAGGKAAYRLVREVLIEGLRTKPDEVVSDAEVLGWWSVVHGLAFLAIDGLLGQVGTSPERVEELVLEVIGALEARQEKSPPAPAARRR
jgi:AcrR family transcriptional regulator